MEGGAARRRGPVRIVLLPVQPRLSPPAIVHGAGEAENLASRVRCRCDNLLMVVQHDFDAQKACGTSILPEQSVLAVVPQRLLTFIRLY